MPQWLFDHVKGVWQYGILSPIGSLENDKIMCQFILLPVVNAPDEK